jgi:insertion element IS1 protein InsB
MSTRGIRRTFGVCCQDTHEVGGGEIEALPAFEDTLLPGQAGDGLELDELWSFVQKKTQECWLWVALCRRTRQIRRLHRLPTAARREP